MENTNKTVEESLRELISETKELIHEPERVAAETENPCDVMGNKTLRKLCEQLELLAELSKKEDTTTEEVVVLSNTMNAIADTVLHATAFLM